MNKKPLLIATVLLGLAGGAWAFGGPGPGGDCPQGMGGGQGMQGAQPMMHGGILRDAYRVDNLTAEQRKQLDALRDQERQRFEANRADREALRDAIAKGADAATLRPLAEKAGKQVTEMIMRQAEVRAQVEKILTEPQRAQLKQMAAGQNDAGGQPRGQGRRGGR